MFKTKLINRFYEALFCTDFNNYESATQNAKTDYLFDFKTFEEWFDKLITVFAAEEEVNAGVVKAEATADPEFIKMLKAEYEELLELCDTEDLFDESF